MDLEIDVSLRTDSDESSDVNSEDSWLTRYWTDMDEVGRVRLEKFKIMRADTNWAIEAERRKFLEKLSHLIDDGNWERQLPDLWDFFQREDIEWLIMESLKQREKECSCAYTRRSTPLIVFVRRSGYKMLPDLDENGNQVSRRATPLHYAASQDYLSATSDLSDVYGYEVNYSDETGFTHLHAGIRTGYFDLIEGLLEHGHAKCLPAESDKVDPPLHYALGIGNTWSAEMLLEKGADPSLANGDGSTPLHIVCRSRCRFDDWTKTFFEVIKNGNGGPVRVDARDKLGRTPLQLAVANLMPLTVDALLDNGADLSGFVFPDESYFVDDIHEKTFEMGLAFGALDVVARLEKRGYELDQNDAQTIMKVFAKHGVFKNPLRPGEKCLLDDAYFVGRSKKLMVGPRVSLHKLCRSPPDQALKLATFADYFAFAHSAKFWKLRDEYRRACAKHLSEIASRRFFRHCALEPLLELTRQRLPILCCEVIIDKLANVDLWCVCLAATGQSAPWLDELRGCRHSPDDDEFDGYFKDAAKIAVSQRDTQE
uniref:Uncharacterized protein n=1 Tax=Trichogramma kaykai TaxID=54128 RepID=A0ABD2VW11_9HYME